MKTADRARQNAGESGVLFAMGVPMVGDSGPVATWITAAHWAFAARRAYGNAWMIGPSGPIAPEAALRGATNPTLSSSEVAAWRARVPDGVKTAVKDARSCLRAWRMRSRAQSMAFDGIAPAFVWSHHELFQTTGVWLARRLNVPLVEFVDAPQVWEARRWGVRRLGWGAMLERVGERPQLRAADVVACVSDEVATAVVEMGIPRQQIVVTPVGVDLQRFGVHASRQDVRRRLGLRNRFVIGWVGSFRPFHSLHLALEATRRLQESVPEVALLLVGDGQERRRIQALAEEMRVHAVFTGTIPYEQVADHVAAMDVAVVLGDGGDAFHYSPLKLREYMASGRPVVAMRAGEVGRVLRDGVDGLLVQPGDASALARAMRLLYDTPELRNRIGTAAREKAVTEWSWDAQLRRVTTVLESAAEVAM